MEQIVTNGKKNYCIRIQRFFDVLQNVALAHDTH